jgi:ATP-dependent protease ClpP protease subunit
VVSKRNITFEEGGQGWVISEGVVEVSSFVTWKCVALVKSLGFFLLFALSQVCRVSFVCSLALMHEFKGSL